MTFTGNALVEIWSVVDVLDVANDNEVNITKEDAIQILLHIAKKDIPCSYEEIDLALDLYLDGVFKYTDEEINACVEDINDYLPKKDQK